jgi:NAD(P)-dependent dehydrogenase (short-subunit alcohol dehydrogenase family)
LNQEITLLSKKLYKGKLKFLEAANVAVFLASEKADYITGATIDVTGGMLMR